MESLINILKSENRVNIRVLDDTISGFLDQNKNLETAVDRRLDEIADGVEERVAKEFLTVLNKNKNLLFETSEEIEKQLNNVLASYGSETKTILDKIHKEVDNTANLRKTFFAFNEIKNVVFWVSNIAWPTIAGLLIYQIYSLGGLSWIL